MNVGLEENCSTLVGTEGGGGKGSNKILSASDDHDADNDDVDDNDDNDI